MKKIILSRQKLHKYMRLHSIPTDFQLLEKIAEKLGVRNSYTYATNERPNFSKMVNGKTSLKVEYIIPLEAIFGVPIVRLVEGTDFAEPEKEFIPFIKGFRYYAYRDDPELYKNEFAKNLLLDDNHSILINADEYGKFFFGYVVLYKSINAIKFLQKNYNLRANFMSDAMLEMDFNGHLEIIPATSTVEIAKLIIEKGEMDLFFKIFNLMSYYHLYHLDLDKVYQNDDVVELFLKNEVAFKSLFKTFNTNFSYLNKHVSQFNGIPSNKVEDFKRINPFLNKCLMYGLKHLDKYKTQVIQLLNYGQQYNEEVLQRINTQYSIRTNDLYTYQFGDLFVDRDILIGSLIIVGNDVKINDIEVNVLLEKLPKVDLRK